MEAGIIAGIRAAIAAGQYDEAALLWNRCAARLREDLDRGVATEAAFAQVAGLLEWSGPALLAARADLAVQLNGANVARIYAGGGGRGL